jgi:protein required for attachment to host cells
MPRTWILLANGHRARFLQHERTQDTLVELAGFIYPAAAALAPSSAAHLKAGQVKANLGHPGKQFEAATAAVEKVYSRFARQLANYLNKAVAERRCDRVALIASGPMVSAIRTKLSAHAADLLLRSVEADFTRYQGAELLQRVQAALGPLA